jgi:soluble P-type ATPase
VFVPAVLLVAAVTFTVWWFGRGDHDGAVLSALSVLLVACPCAMGLAAPVAMMVGCGSASALGIFVRDGDALERLSRVDTVVFDKTGTLTEHRAIVTDVIAAPGIGRDDVLGVAAAVEAESDHPIALAIMAASGSSVRGSDVRAIPGVGVAGLVGGQPVRVGRLDRHRLEGGSLPGPVAAAAAARRARGETVVLVERGDQVLGAIAITTPLRPEAGPSVRRLHQMGISTAILSGDSEPAVATAGAELGIDELQAALSPAGKVAALRAGRLTARSVLMVGDGVNDAPALAAAAVGCAIGSGSQAALANSDVALLGNDLNAVPAAVTLARATYAVMLQNFGWATGYNIAALPLAAAGLIDPLVAAVAMGLSSLLVVANSLRLARLGRSGPAGVRGPRILRGARGVSLSVLLPVLFFAALTVAGQAVSPARGQSLLPQLPQLPQPAGRSPSAISRMVCTPKTAAEIAHVMGTDASVAAPAWADHRYSCGYRYRQGTMVLSVKELSSWPQTYADFGQLARTLHKTTPIARLGQGAFIARDGSVVVRKDWKILQVDISGIHGNVGSPPRPPGEVALYVAQVILDCWAGD